MTQGRTRIERDLVALADGTLSAKRRKAVEERVARSPELRAALERQRRGTEVLQSVADPAPAALRARVQADRAGAVSGGRRSALGAARATVPQRRGFALGAMAATAAAAGALALALALPVGGGGPTVVEASALADRPSLAGAPPPVVTEPALLDRDVQGVAFPNWGPKLGWRATGVRSDRLDDRGATTVQYANDRGARVAYTIVAGEAIDPPDGSRRSERAGLEFHSFRSDGRLVVTWLRDGKTCVLSGESVKLSKLLELGAWAGDGAVKS